MTTAIALPDLTGAPDAMQCRGSRPARSGSAKRDRANPARRRQHASAWREGKPRGCAAPAA
jgi:hypothetical protein